MVATVRPGSLLVAAPSLTDPNFSRGVVLVVEHGAEGTVGVILNRPTEADPRGPLPSWADLLGQPDRVFIGGPVQREVAVGMALVDQDPDHPMWTPVLSDVGLIDLSLEPHDYGPSIREVRVFAGYSGWAGGQLEAEMAQPGWFLVDGLTADAFSRDPRSLWHEVLRRQGGDLALYATYPADPSSN